MSQKMTCPGCTSHTSAILTAFEEGEPCPYCSLPAEATLLVLAAAKRGADEDLQRAVLAAERRATAAEEEVRHLRRIVVRVHAALNGDEDP